MLPYLHELCPVLHVRLNPGKCSPRHSEPCLQPLCQCRVTDHIGGCGQVEANEQCDFLVVSRSVDAVKNIKQRRLGRMS